MKKHIFVCNGGSSSIKFSLFELPSLDTVLQGNIQDVFGTPSLWLKGQEQVKQAPSAPGYESALSSIVPLLEAYTLVAIGHRVVHGGTTFNIPLTITPENLKTLDTLVPLAPLHQPYNIEAIKIFSKLYPDIPQIACFDTAFHRTQPRIAELFALPGQYAANGIIRYGFHGLSYHYISDHLPAEIADKGVIVAHLGNGASMCALQNRKSVATTMGFTALDGLMMGTRSGNIDPGVLLYLLKEKGHSPDSIENLLYHESGLKGVSGISNDVATLLTSDNPDANHAIDLFCYMAARQLGSLLPTLNDWNGIVFTAGIGENCPAIRHKICDYLRGLGVTLDDTANKQNKTIISTPDSKINIYVIPTNEDLCIAQQILKMQKISEP
jgi:acetate kinase